MTSFKQTLVNFAVQTQDESPIFLFSSSHRSGSTLIQRVLNSNPDLMIWGEQRGYLNRLWPAFRDLSQWEAKHSRERQTFLLDGFDNFVPNMMPEAYELREAMVAHLYTLFALPAFKLGRTHWGFKEVRYGAAIALFLQECFPNARFIHLTRHIESCYLSMKRWEQDPDVHWEADWTYASLEDWARINGSFLENNAKLKNYLLIQYEAVLAEPTIFISQLADFLQMPAAAFDQSVFQNRLHNSGEAGKQERKKFTLADLTAEEQEQLLQPQYIALAQQYGYQILEK